MTSKVSGTIVSSSSDSLVVRTDAGNEMSFDLDAQSVVPPNLTSDTRVDVAYHTMDSGTYHAAEVTPAVSSDATPSQDTSQPPPQDPAMEPSKQPQQQAGGSAQSAGEDNLPRTASPIVLVGLIGLASLGAGTGVRLLTR